jgi:hypothetical protein
LTSKENDFLVDSCNAPPNCTAVILFPPSNSGTNFRRPSLTPGPRFKDWHERVKELARAHTSQAIETLVSIMTNHKAAPAARVSAANALLDRGYGKPPQHQHITGADGPQYVASFTLSCSTVCAVVSTVSDPFRSIVPIFPAFISSSCCQIMACSCLTKAQTGSMSGFGGLMILYFAAF